VNAAVGTASVMVALVGSLVLVIRGIEGLFRPDRARAGRFETPVMAVLFGALGAMAVLELALLHDDFSLEYVANHSASSTPFVFKVASAWGALEGSIVLWALTLAVFVAGVWRRYRRRGTVDPLWAGALGILGVIALFFFGLMLTVSNPFRVCVEAGRVGCVTGSGAFWASAQAPLEGLGPNPLLQNHVLMAVHPPVLYVGYVGMAVPFAFAIAALLRGIRGKAWLEVSRSWTLVAWSFLGVGIVLGGLWSYEVLGWGGYWAWDPVENASLIPWLVATAFIHSAVVQRRRGLLQAWNFALVILAFGATILGTFLTRSGVVSSVHSFSQSPVGPVLLWFLAFVLVASFGLFLLRLDVISSSPRLDSLVSREGSFLVNNLILSIFAFVVVVGTLYPLFLEALTGDKASIGPPFFNRFAIPISITLLVVMAIGTVAPWRAASWSLLWERTRGPLVVAFGVGAAVALSGRANGYLLVGIVSGVFVIATAARTLAGRVRRRTAKTDESIPAALRKVIVNDPRYWSGQLSHVGVAVLAIGIALSANLVVTGTFDMTRSDTVEFAGMRLTFVEPAVVQETNRTILGARIAVARGERPAGTLMPAINDYFMQGMKIGTPSVATSWRGDLYLTLDRIDESRIALEAKWFPFLWMVWVGGFLIGLAPLLGWALRRGSRRVTTSVPDRREPAAEVTAA